MLIQQTISQMRELRLTGMLNALELQMGQAAIQSLPFEDRLGMLVDAEVSTRDTKRMTKLQGTSKNLDSPTLGKLTPF